MPSRAHPCRRPRLHARARPGDSAPCSSSTPLRALTHRPAHARLSAAGRARGPVPRPRRSALALWHTPSAARRFLCATNANYQQNRGALARCERAVTSQSPLGASAGHLELTKPPARAGFSREPRCHWRPQVRRGPRCRSPWARPDPRRFDALRDGDVVRGSDISASQRR